MPCLLQQLTFARSKLLPGCISWWSVIASALCPGDTPLVCITQDSEGLPNSFERLTSTPSNRTTNPKSCTATSSAPTSLHLSGCKSKASCLYACPRMVEWTCPLNRQLCAAYLSIPCLLDFKIACAFLNTWSFLNTSNSWSCPTLPPKIRW